MDLHDCICDRIQKVDRSVRYVGLANKMGTRIEDHYRKGLDPLLKENELDLCIRICLTNESEMWYAV
jgi:hypothetical protein